MPKSFFFLNENLKLHLFDINKIIVYKLFIFFFFLEKKTIKSSFFIINKSNKIHTYSLIYIQYSLN